MTKYRVRPSMWCSLGLSWFIHWVYIYWTHPLVMLTVFLLPSVTSSAPSRVREKDCSTSQLTMASSSETPLQYPSSSISSELPPVSFPPLSSLAMFYSSRSWVASPIFVSVKMIWPGHKQLFLLGLRFRSAVQLAPSAFLASVATLSNLVSHVLQAYLQSLPTPYLDITLSRWSQDHDNPPPSGNAVCIQKSWDASIVSSTVESLLENSADDLAQAWLLAASAKESGA